MISNLNYGLNGNGTSRSPVTNDDGDDALAHVKVPLFVNRILTLNGNLGTFVSHF